MQTANIFENLDFSVEKLRKVGVFATERMVCDVYCFEKGQEQKVHRHEAQDKVYFVLEGRAAFNIGGELRELEAGSAVLAPAGVEHGVRNTYGERTLCLVFMSPPPPPRE